MKQAFLDTFFILALANSNDEHHGAAVEMRKDHKHGSVITEYVLLEVLDALTIGPARELGMQVVDAIRNDKNITIIPASTALMERGIALFAARADKEWGLTDCISFVVMQEHKITDALTADQHFVQAGFNALLR